ncbi:MAG: hypothetical protein KDA37_03525 [Planctomycetales bacterium]|nr:hypothetical protein [Planctomycetales bacterium]
MRFGSAAGLLARHSAVVVVVVFCPAQLVLAAIGSTGSVTPNPVADPTQSSADLFIGDDFLGDADTVDPRAKVTVDDSDANSLLEFNQIFVGYDVGFFGRLEVTGEGATVRLTDGGSNTNAALEVGRLGNGYASFKNGASLVFTNSVSDLVIGSDAGSIGEMLVDTGSFVDLKQDLIVGDAGVGTLTISGGSLVRTTKDTSPASAAIFGDETTGSGYVTVTGAQTILQLSDDLTVGRLGIGELTIADGALVDADNTSSQTTIGALGKVRLLGGAFDVRDVNVSGYLGGHGVVRGQVDVLASGDVQVSGGELLNLEDTVNNSGAITITDGEIRFLDAATTSATGRLTLEDGVVRYSQTHTNNGVIASAKGTSNLHGAINNAAGGTVVVASETIAVFNDTYTDAGTTTVLSRGNALFLADAIFTSTALVGLSLDAASGVNQSAQIVVGGNLDIQNASLALSFSPDFDLSTSQSLELIHTDGLLTGEFVPPVFPNVQGVDFGLVYSASGVMLDISVDLNNVNPGDFNGDGVVNAADYTVWRDGLGGAFSQADYLVWRDNYGNTYAALPAASGQAPEPAGVALALLVLAAVGNPRRR